MLTGFDKAGRNRRIVWIFSALEKKKTQFNNVSKLMEITYIHFKSVDFTGIHQWKTRVTVMVNQAFNFYINSITFSRGGLRCKLFLLSL